MDTYVSSQTGGMSGLAQSDTTLLIGQLTQVLRRFLWLIVLCAAVAAAGAFIYSHSLPKTYTASALMAVEGDHFAIPELSGALRDDNSPDPMPMIHTEVQALSSRALISQVAAQMHLDANPEFNPALRPITLQQRLKDMVGGLLSPILPQAPALPADASSSPGAVLPPSDEPVVGSVAHALSIFQDNRSLVIAISFTSQDPQLAARFVNTLLETYVVSRARHRGDANAEASAVIAQRVVQARADLDAVEKQINDLRSKGDVVGVRAGSIGQQQVEELTSAAARATLERSQLEVSYERAAAAAKQGSSDALASVLQSPTISQLRNQVAQSSQHLAELSSHYGPNYPGMRAAAAQLASAQGQLGSETSRIVASLGAQLRVARDQEADVKQQLDAARHGAVTAENARAGLEQLQQEAGTRRGLYQTLLERSQQTVAQPISSQTPDVRVLSPAVPPASPSGPNMRLAALMGGSGGGLLGCLIALTQLKTTRRVENAEDLTQATGLIVAATLPRQLVRNGQGLLASGPPSEAGEADAQAMRALHARLRFTGRSGVPRCILFLPEASTSASASICGPLAACFARAVAGAGERVLLIEADLHTSPLTPILGARTPRSVGQTGLLAVLAGTDWRDAVSPDVHPGLDLLLASGRASAHEALNGAHFQNLLVETREEYDLIVVNAPSAATADAVLLVQRADSAVLVIDGRIERAVAHDAAARLTAATRTPLAAVLVQRT